jgi:acyl-coenzyme A synthetase/AMP-(fatty) acid ligase
VVVCWTSGRTGNPKSIEGIVAYAGETRVQVRWEYSVLIEGELVVRTKLRWFPRSQVRRARDAEQEQTHGA